MTDLTNVRNEYKEEFLDPLQIERDMHFSRLPMWRRMKDEAYAKRMLESKLAYLQEITLQELAGEL